MSRELEIFGEVPGLKIERKKLAQLVEVLDAKYKPNNSGTLSIAFISHKRLTQMHADFCDDGTPTDIITFPGLNEDFGELCISPQAAREYVKKNGGTFDAEMKRYVIHGYLHLVGYDDLTAAKRKKMKVEEARMLKACAKLKVFSLRVQKK